MYVFTYTQGLCEHCNCKRVRCTKSLGGGGGGECIIAVLHLASRSNNLSTKLDPAPSSV